ncbi:hypothetical protein ACGFIK_14885 [Micromonospora sp. NPDC048871]|uniref:hypothetical protein n=1 Tax=unclassified Micromonospora TaxID=2617518 RepID=UPI002E11EAB5|nr:hypothetical protein OIE53_10785 [Micromonospora sp. NBC_01739]
MHDRRKPDGRGWAVLADPDGNEFRVLRRRRGACRRPERPAGSSRSCLSSPPRIDGISGIAGGVPRVCGGE